MGAITRSDALIRESVIHFFNVQGGGTDERITDSDNQIADSDARILDSGLKFGLYDERPKLAGTNRQSVSGLIEKDDRSECQIRSELIQINTAVNDQSYILIP